jgi:hypothetical protein
VALANHDWRAGRGQRSVLRLSFREEVDRSRVYGQCQSTRSPAPLLDARDYRRGQDRQELAQQASAARQPTSCQSGRWCSTLPLRRPEGNQAVHPRPRLAPIVSLGLFACVAPRAIRGAHLQDLRRAESAAPPLYGDQSQRGFAVINRSLVQQSGDHHLWVGMELRHVDLIRHHGVRRVATLGPTAGHSLSPPYLALYRWTALNTR